MLHWLVKFMQLGRNWTISLLGSPSDYSRRFCDFCVGTKEGIHSICVNPAIPAKRHCERAYKSDVVNSHVSREGKTGLINRHECVTESLRSWRKSDIWKREIKPGQKQGGRSNLPDSRSCTLVRSRLASVRPYCVGSASMQWSSMSTSAFDPGSMYCHRKKGKRQPQVLQRSPLD